jgi:hypothetical protein
MLDVLVEFRDGLLMADDGLHASTDAEEEP